MEKAKAYIEAVLSGKLVAGKYIKKVLQRHVDDLKKQKDPNFPYYFSEDDAQHPIDCFSLFKLPKGNVANQPFVLMPFQETILALAYGWRRKDNGLRRYRRIYLKVARGNAKTEFLVGIGTYGHVFDGEPNPEIFWIATKSAQAKVGWDRQAKMMKMLLADEPELNNLFSIYATKIASKHELGWTMYLGQDSDKEDGWKPYYVLVDEYHAHKDDDLINVLQSGMVKRGDPMTWIITTAGFNPQGPNSDFLKRCKQMLDGVLPGESTLPFIYELDEKDDWKDEANWIKANPGLGYVLTMDSLRAEYEQIALIGKTKEIDFKVKNLNIEHKGADTWIRMDDWEKCRGNIDLKGLTGRECYAGIDLSLTDDISALALFFPKKADEKRHILKVFFWIPEEKAEIEAQNGIPYRKWIAEGLIKATDGNVIDHDDLAADIIDICKGFKMKRMEIDPWTSKTVQLALQKAGLPFGTVAQNLTSLGNPTQVFERMIKGAELNHGGDEVLTWMASNCQIHIHASGFYMVHKGKSGKLKVDGIVASICAVYGWVDDGAKVAKSSYLFEKDAKVILI